jgi:uncharacterized membrane protein YcaP (DUF421 family)
MEIVLQTTVVFFALWLLMRGLGKRELSEMSPFDVILLVVMGDLVQQGITQEDMSVTGALLAICTIALWVLVFSFASWRWQRVGKVLEGSPVVVVRDGRLIEEALRMERLPVSEVLEAARQQGIADLSDVRLAVFEPSGRISFITGGGG